jgi:hypothetical protein
VARPILVAVLVALAVALVAAPAQATFPGRNGALVFTREFSRGAASASLAQLDPVTGESTETQFCSGFAAGSPLYCRYAGGPAISPDGTRAAVVTDDADVGMVGSELRVSLRLLRLADGEQVSVSLSGDGYSDRPATAWSAGGDRLLVSRDSGLYLVDLGGREEALVAAGAADPDWAVDGRIAFVRGGDIWTGPAAGPFMPLTGRGGGSPSWSPHGRWIAFSRGHAIYVVRATGGRRSEWSQPARSVPGSATSRRPGPRTAS